MDALLEKIRPKFFSELLFEFLIQDISEKLEFVHLSHNCAGWKPTI